ncbi:ABC transporter permease [Kineosporia sp. NBRC 101677]|uniref:ABC transporter permease n=1 Tax=Kineosporia sp. NBRC 101677 TaxID=3032197 RepID=UPI0024A364C2|nr:ABC transporter permease subunit [Kineosporia sp. NBRC 101677]GLY17467.1 ABC transporter permease [Kineosporia sp. NBRC 101677]
MSLSVEKVTRGTGSGKRQPRALDPFLWGATGVLCFWGLWELAALATGNDAVLPGPRVVLWEFQHGFQGDRGLEYLGIRQSGYVVNLAWTVGTAAGAWLIGSTLGILAGLASARRQWLRDVTEPVLFFFGAVPVLVAAPLFLVWFGAGPLSKLALVTFYCFVVVGVVAQSAALNIPPTTEEYAATLGLDNKARFRAVVLPSAFPPIVAVLRLALATGISLEASAELLGSRAGVGRLIAVRAQQGNVGAVLALAIALGLVALVLDVLIRAAVAPALRWQG